MELIDPRPADTEGNELHRLRMDGTVEQPPATPEPATYGLLGLGLGWLGIVRRRASRRGRRA